MKQFAYISIIIALLVFHARAATESASISLGTPSLGVMCLLTVCPSTAASKEAAMACPGDCANNCQVIDDVCCPGNKKGVCRVSSTGSTRTVSIFIPTATPTITVATTSAATRASVIATGSFTSSRSQSSTISSSHSSTTSTLSTSDALERFISMPIVFTTALLAIGFYHNI